MHYYSESNCIGETVMKLIIEKTPISGAFVIHYEPFNDERGSFTRMFCRQELESHGLNAQIAQMNLSINNKRGTLRGLHSQTGDAMEDKLVTCLYGSIFDVCVDVHKDSPTFGHWVGRVLSPENGTALYIPKGCAHGYLSLTDDSHLLYLTTEFYQPGMEIGYRFDDPVFSICWPLPGPYILSAKDNNLKYL